MLFWIYWVYPLMVVLTSVFYFLFKSTLGHCGPSFCRPYHVVTILIFYYVLDAATSSGILKAKQKIGRTFNSDKLGGIAFTKISKLTMCSA